MMAAPFQWSLAALGTPVAEGQMGQHGAVLRAFSVVELWWLRHVCRACWWRVGVPVMRHARAASQPALA